MVNGSGNHRIRHRAVEALGFIRGNTRHVVEWVKINGPQGYVEGLLTSHPKKGSWPALRVCKRAGGRSAKDRYLCGRIGHRPVRCYAHPIRFRVEISVGAIIQSKYRVCWGPHQTRNDTNYRIETLYTRDVARETRPTAHRSHGC